MSKQKEPNQPQDSFSPKTTRIHISRRERRSQFYNIHKLKGYEKEARRNSKRKAA